jgi:hypothetical protein
MKDIDLSKYTLEEIVELKDRCSAYLYNHDDGYAYICKVRSYGRNWREFVSNEFTLQELCHRYTGEDGIVDVYSTNPNLHHIENYGEVMYIESEDEYVRWSNYHDLIHTITEIEFLLDKWNNKDELPFYSRPMFGPLYSQDDLSYYKNKLEEYDMSFISPRPYKKEDIA